MSPRRLAALVLLAVLLGGCSLAGRTFGTYVDDKAITGSVKVRLIGEYPRALKSINVDTFEGTVYLSGDVDTPQQKADAEIAAWRAEGVEQVINDLRVRSAPAVSASPRMTVPNPLQERVPGIARLDPALPGAPSLAYDRAGAIVATVYARPLQDVVSLHPPVSADRGSGDIGHAQVGEDVVDRRAFLAEQLAELREGQEIPAVGEGCDSEGPPGPGSQ